MNEPIFSVLTGKSCTTSSDCAITEVCCNNTCYEASCQCTDCWGSGIDKSSLGIPLSHNVWCNTDNNGNPITTYQMEVSDSNGFLVGFVDCPGFGGDFYQPAPDPNCSDPDEYLRPGQTVSWTCTISCCPGGWVYSSL